MMAGNIAVEGFFVAENPSAADKERLLQTFPEEIWLMIFNYLQDSKDLINVINASPALRKMLQERKKQYLFPDVYHILGTKLEKEENERCKASEDGSAKSRNTILLPLRLVSRAWKDAIDRYHFNQALPDVFPGTGTQTCSSISRNDIFSPDYFFEMSSNRLTKFLAHFEATHANGRSKSSPFLSSSVRFNIPFFNNPSHRNLEGTISQLFQAYGQHIRICSFQMKISDMNTKTFSMFQRWISLLPNLVSLSVAGSRYDDKERDFLEVTQPLPNLDKLKHLMLMRVIPSVENLFLKTYNHVAYLHVNPMHDFSSHDVISIPYPNLTDLTITLHTMSDFQKLETAQFSSKFCNLAVTFYTQPPLPAVFALLERKWGTRLKRFNISIQALAWATSERRKRVEKEIKRLKQQHLPGLEEEE